MFQQLRTVSSFLPERLRTELGPRATGILLALALEALLILLLLTLGRSGDQPEEAREVVSTFDATSAEQAAPPEAQPDAPQPKSQPTPQPPTPEKPAPDQPQPAPSPPALIPVPRDQMESLDISKIPSNEPPRPQQNRPMMGPVNTRSQPDTPRVGTAPNGEPLYAARWYREPYDNELAGYLSTASGPGWGTIACKTAPEYRVEDCVALDEYPANSNIARAALAAAWQFKVRPPRLGGRSLVGEWVRIRIEYGIKPAPAVP